MNFHLLQSVIKQPKLLPMGPEYEIFYFNIQTAYKKYETIVKTKLLLGKMNKKLSSINMPPR